jgi:diaminopimelate epimerase
VLLGAVKVIVRLPFWKVQAIGNDFVLVHLDDVATILSSAGIEAAAVLSEPVAACGASPRTEPGLAPSLSRLAIAACDRRFGVGGDGLLVLSREPGALILRMYNSDGSEDFCGNGLRCAAMHASLIGWMQSPFRIHHLGRTVLSEILPNGSIRQVIGSASWHPDQVPLAPEAGGELRERAIDLGPLGSRVVSSLSTGSTHTVLMTDRRPQDAEFLPVSEAIETHPWFPERTSVIWTYPVADDRLEIRIWERGVGETFGCGTGSAAAAAAWSERLGRGGRFTVVNPGGELIVELDPETGLMHTEGPAQAVYSGEYLLSL